MDYSLQLSVITGREGKKDMKIESEKRKKGNNKEKRLDWLDTELKRDDLKECATESRKKKGKTTRMNLI